MAIKIVVASKNPVKLNAVKSGFTKMFPSNQLEIEAVSVPSGVDDQPSNDEMTLTGAMNRAENAREEIKNADYWVGIEGGIEKTGKEMAAFAWVAVHSEEKTGKARTATFFLPEAVVSLIDEGKELGEADDIVFGHENSKQKNGAAGLLTENVIDRTSLYSEAVVLALIPFKNPDLY